MRGDRGREEGGSVGSVRECMGNMTSFVFVGTVYIHMYIHMCPVSVEG